MERRTRMRREWHKNGSAAFQIIVLIILSNRKTKLEKVLIRENTFFFLLIRSIILVLIDYSRVKLDGMLRLEPDICTFGQESHPLVLFQESLFVFFTDFSSRVESRSWSRCIICNRNVSLQIKQDLLIEHFLVSDLIKE